MMGKAIQLLARLMKASPRNPPKSGAKPVPKTKETFPKTKPSSATNCPSGNCAPATKEEILKGSTPGKKSSSRQHHKPGGMDQANKDFDAMTRGVKVVDRGGGKRTAELPDGTKLTVRPISSGKDPKPTLEIIPLKGKTDKIRYE